MTVYKVYTYVLKGAKAEETSIYKCRIDEHVLLNFAPIMRTSHSFIHALGVWSYRAHALCVGVMLVSCPDPTLFEEKGLVKNDKILGS